MSLQQVFSRHCIATPVFKIGKMEGWHAGWSGGRCAKFRRRTFTVLTAGQPRHANHFTHSQCNTYSMQQILPGFLRITINEIRHEIHRRDTGIHSSVITHTQLHLTTTLRGVKIACQNTVFLQQASHALSSCHCTCTSLHTHSSVLCLPKHPLALCPRLAASQCNHTKCIETHIFRSALPQNSQDQLHELAQLSQLKNGQRRHPPLTSQYPLLTLSPLRFLLLSLSPLRLLFTSSAAQPLTAPEWWPAPESEAAAAGWGRGPGRSRARSRAGRRAGGAAGGWWPGGPWTGAAALGVRAGGWVGRR